MSQQRAVADVDGDVRSLIDPELNPVVRPYFCTGADDAGVVIGARRAVAVGGVDVPTSPVVVSAIAASIVFVPP